MARFDVTDFPLYEAFFRDELSIGNKGHVDLPTASDLGVARRRVWDRMSGFDHCCDLALSALIMIGRWEFSGVFARNLEQPTGITRFNAVFGFDFRRELRVRDNCHAGRRERKILSFTP